MNNPSYGYNEPQNPMDNRTVHYNTNYNTNYTRSSGKGCLLAVIAILALMFGSFFIFVMFISLFSSDSSSVLPTEPYVEILHVEGGIQSANYNSYGVPVGYQHQWTIHELSRLEEDDLNKGIILYLNSPGGGVYESYELYTALERYKENTGRPIVVYMAQYAASGALMAAMAGDEIYANQMTTTGSIGVIMSYIDTSGLMEKLGVEQINIVSGPNKAIGSGKLTEEQRQILQDTVDEYYQSFIKIVSDSREIELSAVKKIADGRTYTASQALKLKLIDNIADYSDFIDAMRERVEFSDCLFIDNYYQDTSLLGTIFSKLNLEAPSASQPAQQLGDVLNLLEDNQTPVLSYSME